MQTGSSRLLFASLSLSTLLLATPLLVNALIIPSYDDASANWKNAGLLAVGGIPNRTTQCGATLTPSSGDDFTQIQNAINNCPAGQVVQLGAGTFNVHMADLPIKISTGVVLRGTGTCGGSSSPYCQTSITVSDGALTYTGGKCGTDTAHEVGCPNGGPSVIDMSPVSPDYNYSWAQCGNIGSTISTGCGATPLTTDAAQGQTTIQVGSTASFSVGQWVLIDEASGAGWVADPLNPWTAYGNVWAASDWLNPSGSPATGRVMWPKSQNGGGWDFGPTFPYQANTAGCWHSYCDRATAELHKIASIGSGTLTFDDPLTIAFRQSGNHNAQVYGGLYPNQSGAGSPISFLQNAGVENLSVLRGVDGGMAMEFCANCWIKNVEVGYWYGGGISIEYSARSELNNVYVHHAAFSVNNGGEYPIALDSASTEILITNSITNFAGKGMVARSGGAGSVVSYSYVDDSMYDEQSGIGDYWIDVGLNASHFSGPHHVLFEGNWADNLDSDHTHGPSTYMTYFRNQGTGLRTPFTDPSNGKAVNDAAGVGNASGQSGNFAPGPLRAAGPSAYSYWFAYVGNVLGLAGKTTVANGWSYQGDWTGHRIFMLGWNDGAGGQDPYLNGVIGSYIFRDGNFDYVNNAVIWDPSDTAHTLPNSLYLSSTPSFFGASGPCTYSWPWITPTGSIQVQTNSCGGSGLPAKARWEAGTPLSQSGGPIDTTPPSTPTALSGTAISSSQINLTWPASTDNVGVTGYKIFRNSTQVGTSATASYSDTGLTASTVYSYTVSAYDAAGNNSSQSSSISVTTQPPGIPAPTVTISASPTSVASSGSSTLTWSSTNATSCTASGGWSGAKATSGSQTLTNLTVTATYTLACTGPGGTTTQSATITVTGNNSTITIGETNILTGGDSGNANLLLAQNTTLSQTATIQSLSFYVSSAAGSLRLGIYDATGPSGGPGALKAQTNAFTPVVGWNTVNVVTPMSLSPGTYWLSYLPSDNSLSFQVDNSSGTLDAYGFTFGPLPATYSTAPYTAAGHWSLYATLSTSASTDTTPPSTPTALSGTAISSSQINLTWSASTDNVGVTGYKVYRNSTQVGTSATNNYSDTGLTASTVYSYTVSAYDAAGNTSAQTGGTKVITLGASAPSIAIGSRVVTTANLNVRSSASVSASKLGTESVGALGTVIGGPTVANGHTWWQINYDNAISGWSIVRYLVPVTAISSPAVGMAAPATLLAGRQPSSSLINHLLQQVQSLLQQIQVLQSQTAAAAASLRN